MHSSPLIGIAGLARSGKDTVADFILAARGGYKYSFADPIRAMLLPLGIDMSLPYWQERKETVIPALGVSPRRLMQTLGTEWGRAMVHPNMWVYLAHQQYKRQGPGMIIADVRFDNEAIWIRQQGGNVIHVFRDNAPQVAEHSSEAGVTRESVDTLLFNQGPLDELQATVSELLRVSETRD